MRKIVTLMLACMLAASVLCGFRGIGGLTFAEADEVGYVTVYTSDEESSDVLTVEEVELDAYTETSADAHFFRWKVKVRNTSGQDLLAKKNSMRIWYNYLDENEDVLFSHYAEGGYSSTVKNGRAEWVAVNEVPESWDKKDFETVAYIEIFGFDIDLNEEPDYEYEEPILIDVREILAEEEDEDEFGIDKWLMFDELDEYGDATGEWYPTCWCSCETELKLPKNSELMILLNVMDYLVEPHFTFSLKQDLENKDDIGDDPDIELVMEAGDDSLTGILYHFGNGHLFSDPPRKRFDFSKADTLDELNAIEEKAVEAMLLRDEVNDFIYEHLKNGEDIECVLSINYRDTTFTIPSAGFPKIAEETEETILGYYDGLEDAIADLYHNVYAEEYYPYLKRYLKELPVLTDEELKEVLADTAAWDRVPITPEDEDSTYSEVARFSDGKEISLGYVRDGNFTHSSLKTERDYKVKEGAIVFSFGTFEFRKLTDDFYLVYMTDDMDPNWDRLFLYTRYDEKGNPLDSSIKAVYTLPLE